MSNLLKQNDTLSQLKRALVALKEMRAKLDEVEQTRHEPIAVIGMGCRFPGGANSPDAFWQLLKNGVDAISEVPSNRWDIDALFDPDPTASGKVSTRWGGFIDRIEQFDAPFFGISPREASQMDPQQRLLLEVTWEALENAGQTKEMLAGSQTGVFIGVHSHSSDYSLLQYADPATLDIYAGTGTAHNVFSGRLSYWLDLHGPSIAIDTACSSSLVAVHLACQSLHTNECRAALVGGVNLMLSPLFTIAASKMQMLAPDGRCKTFDAQANGFVRGEGCGVVMLKRLSSAIEDGDPILALIRGSAINQDGSTNGLTAPNGLSQEAVLRQALKNAQIKPSQISYVEAHGTGTVLGDPIEIESLSTVFNAHQAENQRCFLGSAKSNIGHLEGAAGIAGLIKAILSIQHKTIPPLVHFTQLNPHISLTDTPFTIPTTTQPWSPAKENRVAGVSSFGWSGTNAHVVLEEAPQVSTPATENRETKDGEVYLLPLSAHTPEALEAVVQSYRNFLDAKKESLLNICYTAALRRSHHEYRLCLAGNSHQEMSNLLTAWLEREMPLGLAVGQATVQKKPGLVFVFPGQGSQWFGMGRELLRREPVFKESLEQCGQAIQQFADWSLLKELTADEANSRLDEIDVIQPVLFAIQVALAALWKSWGIVPDAVIGHSMGEIAAAHVAGALSLEDAARIICLRSQLLRRVSGQGVMAVVGLPIEQAQEALAGLEERISIAVSNSPRSTVLSGDPTAMETVLNNLQANDIFCRLIKVDVASHSPQMDPLRDDLLRLLETIQPQTATTPIYSTVTGTISNGAACDANYWANNLRQPVLFSKMVQQLLEDDLTVFVELSPHPILLPAIEETIHHLKKSGYTIPSLRREQAEQITLLSSLGNLFTVGAVTDWQNRYLSAGHFVNLPNYPWQHQSFWIEQTERMKGSGLSNSFSGSGTKERHPLLGWRLDLASPGNSVWNVELNRNQLPYLYDHRLQDTPVLAASTYLEIAFALAAIAFPEDSSLLTDLSFQRALFLPKDSSKITLQVTLSPGSNKSNVVFGIYSRENESWIQHVTGKIQFDSGSGQENVTFKPPQEQTLQTESGVDFYTLLENNGVQIGASLQTVSRLWRNTNGVVGKINIGKDAINEMAEYQVHPSLLDACFQLSAMAIPSFSTNAELFMPYHIDRVRLYNRPAATMWSRVNVEQNEAQHSETVTEDIWLFDETGHAVAEISGLHLQQLSHNKHQPVSQTIDDWLYTLQWQPVAPLEIDQSTTVFNNETWLVLADSTGAGEALTAQIEQSGGACVLVSQGDLYQKTGTNHYKIRSEQGDDVQKLLSDLLKINQPPIKGIVHLWSLDAPTTSELTTESLETAQGTGCGSAIHFVKQLAQTDWKQRPRLWLVTRGAQSVSKVPQQDIAVAQVPLWGLGRVIAEEHPEFFGKLLDLDPAGSTTEIVDALQKELSTKDKESQITIRGEQRYGARLVRLKQQSSTGITTATPWRTDSAYLITGGLGGVGIHVARWLVEHGVRRLILVGRTQFPPRTNWDTVEQNTPLATKIEAIRDLEAMGAGVHLASIDVANEDQLKSFLENYQKEGWPPIRGVIHAAATIDDRLLLNLDLAALKTVLRPKTSGAWLLHKLLGNNLEHFILFSSVGSLLGQTGQANYAAANAFLDGLAHFRRQQKQPALSLNWGAWSGLGFAVTAGGQRTIQTLEEQGIAAFTAAQGLEAFGKSLTQDMSQVAVMPVDWSKFRDALNQTSSRNMFLTQLTAEAATGKKAQISGQNRPQKSSIRQQLLATEVEQRQELLEKHLQKQISRVLRLSSSNIAINKPLGSMGFDSLMALELRNRLEVDMDLTLSATLVWNYPTVVELVSYLAEKMEFPLESRTQPDDAPEISNQTTPQRPQKTEAKLHDILTDVESLSDEEALNALLNK